MLRPFFPELVMSTDLLSFEHPLELLFCIGMLPPNVYFIQVHAIFLPSVVLTKPDLNKINGFVSEKRLMTSRKSTILNIEFCTFYNYQKVPKKTNSQNQRSSWSNELNHSMYFDTNMACYKIGHVTHKVIYVFHPITTENLFSRA